MHDQLKLDLNAHHITRAEYLFVINPPQNILGDINQFKAEYLDRFGEAKFLISKPHITVGNCLLDIRKEGALIDRLKQQIRQVSAFEISLEGFATFDPTGVLFVVPKPILMLNEIQQLLKMVFRAQFNLKSDSHKGHQNPHLTIARAYDKQQFLDSKAHFLSKAYSAKFPLEEIVVLKRTKIARKWESHEKLALA